MGGTYALHGAYVTRIILYRFVCVYVRLYVVFVLVISLLSCFCLCFSSNLSSSLPPPSSPSSGIFKAMQSDGSVARTADLLSKCQRLEKENTDLANKCSVLDQTELELNSMGTQVILLKAEKVEMNAKIEDLEREMRRRETGMSETVFMSGVCVRVLLSTIHLFLC